MVCWSIVRRYTKIFFLILSSLLISCGFRLRGMVNKSIGFDNIAITNTSSVPDLTACLKSQLQTYGIHIINDTKKARYLLFLVKDSFTQQLTNVAASTIPRQYLLNYTLYYTVIEAKNNKPVIAEQQLVVTRQLTMNNNRLLGSDFEAALVIKEMHQNICARLIDSLSRQHNAY